MKLIVASCLLACAMALPQDYTADELRQRDREAQITSFTNQNLADGSNENSFASDNGIERNEKITLREVEVINDNGDKEIRVVPNYEGTFKYQQQDGSFVERRYSTGPTGALVIEGADLPVAPDAPPAF